MHVDLAPSLPLPIPSLIVSRNYSTCFVNDTGPTYSYLALTTYYTAATISTPPNITQAQLIDSAVTGYPRGQKAKKRNGSVKRTAVRLIDSPIHPSVVLRQPRSR
jgi:hypothetical protein